MTDCYVRFEIGHDAILEYQPGVRHRGITITATAESRPHLIGILCGAAAALCWAAGFVVAKYGITIGFSPADLAFHRFFWSGLLLMPLALRHGLGDLGGIGWGRGLIVSVLAGPPQAFTAYSGYILVPLGHGNTIQPACAALGGLVLASAALHEPLSGRRVFGAAAILAGMLVFGVEAFTTIGPHGVGGDLMFVLAGLFWATFGMVLRLWHLPGMRAIGVVATLSVLFYAPLYFIVYGFGDFLKFGLFETLLQAVIQGLIAGAVPIYLFARAVTTLGAGRASMFTSLVPVFGMIIGFLALGIVPTWTQLLGLAIVLIGFQLTLRQQ